MRCCLTSLAIMAVIAGAVVGGGYLYVKSPELRPVETYLPSPSWDEIRESIPFLRPAYAAQPPLSPEAQRDLDALIAKYEAPLTATSQSVRQREDTALRQLQAAGLPVSGVWMLETAAGEPIMTVGLDYARMTSGSDDPGRMLAEGLRSFLRAAEAKSFDLSGTSYVTVAVRDDAGRVLLAVTGATADVESFRAGKINRKQFIAQTAAQIQSREAAFGVVGKVVQ